MTALLRAFVQGDPGTAKTGSVAALANAGFRVVLADFDGNPEPLIVRVKDPEALHIRPFADELVGKDNGIERVGTVSCVRQFGKWISQHGREWGPETVFVLDSISSFSDAVMRLALKLNRGITREGAHIGIATDEIEEALGLVKQLKCHVIVISHLKLISPKAESSYGDETELQKQIKRERAALEETAYFPYMPGVQVARTIVRMFSTALLYELTDKNKLVIRTKPLKGYTIKCPVEVADPLPIESGLLTIVKALEAV